MPESTYILLKILSSFAFKLFIFESRLTKRKSVNISEVTDFELDDFKIKMGDDLVIDTLVGVVAPLSSLPSTKN